MSRWRCPTCGREFGRVNQGHTCSSGCTVQSVLADRPEWMAQAYAEVLATLRPLGPVHEDAVSVGVFLKAQRTVAEFRPKARVVHLVLVLPVPVEHGRLTRLRSTATRQIHRLTLRSPEDVDDEVRDWLRLAHDHGSG